MELFSLLMNAEPVVYLSNDLPRMEKSGQMPTRALNAFESAGLKKIEAGDALYLREAQGTILLLGAIRSAEQCVKCQGGERGDLEVADLRAENRQLKKSLSALIFKDEPRNMDLTPEDGVFEPTLAELIAQIQRAG